MITTDTPAVISCALIGGFASRNPHHPRNFADIVREGVAAAQAGAAILHIHARTDAGEPTQDAAVYRAIGDAIRDQAPDVVLNYTTAGSPGMSDDERLESLSASPELASLDAGTMNFGPEIVFTNTQAFIDRMATEMRAAAVKPEIECFDVGMVMTGRRLVERGLVDSPALFQFVLGVPGGVPARVDTLCHLVALLPENANWGAVAIGAAHFPVMAAALALGGHVRTGLEDVSYIARGEHAGSNAVLVERAAALCRAVGRPVASAAQARSMLGLADRAAGDTPVSASADG